MSHPDGVLVYNIEDMQTKGDDQTLHQDPIPDDKIKIQLHNDAFYKLTNIDFTPKEQRPDLAASQTDKIFFIEENEPEN